MLKQYFITVLLLITALSLKAQGTIAQDDWQNVIGYLNNEDWKNAARQCQVYLNKIPNSDIDQDDAAILKYMFIISEAGLMNKRVLTKEQAIKNVQLFEGHNVVLPAHLVSLKEGFNAVELLNNKTDTLFITESNKTATEIFTFAYIIPEVPYSLSMFKNNDRKMCRIGGRLKSIKVEGISFPRFKIIIDKAQIVMDSN